MRERPLLAITVGDPAGIGPEVVVAALAKRVVRGACRPLVLGDARVLRQAAAVLGRRFPARVVTSAAEAGRYRERVCLLDLANADPDTIPIGRVSAAAGRAAAQCITRAVELARSGEVAGIVTAPINKEALRLAGLPYPGHTEMLASLCGGCEVAMLLVARPEGRHGGPPEAGLAMHGSMRISHVTTHLSLRQACDRVKRERVLSVIRLTDEGLRRMKLPRRRIAVAGLNPHAGESGLFGDEEIREIAPAVADARAEGIDAIGPLPPDTVFARQRAGEFDAVVAMVHDHGHIAVKTVGFVRDSKGRTRTAGVNVTLGLPIIRTSVDHGTAFDIAGKGLADPTSMVEAIVLAAEMAARS
jgi:4-hydroxythreonine-4-phosphate dehydrogenase